MITNSENSYGLVAKLLHWIVAVMIISIISVGFYMTSMDNSAEKYEIYGMHKAFGVLVLAIVVFRLIWRQINIKVLPVEDVPQMLKFLASIGHFLLYSFMLIMPISGLMMSLFGGYDVPFFNLFTIHAFEKQQQLSGVFKFIHEASAKLLVILIVSHVVGALYHHFIRKDQVLKRMI